MRYLIDGCYGDTNIGDECLLDSIIKIVLKSDENAEICVLSDDPKVTQAEFGIESIQQCNPFGISIYGAIIKARIFPVLREISRCDVFILGGGELFRDDKGFRATAGMFYRMVIAKCLGKKTYAIGVGMKKIKSWWGRLLFKKILKAHDHIIFRSEIARKIANKHIEGLNNNSLAPDPVFSLNWPEVLKLERDDPKEIHFGIAVKGLKQNHPQYQIACIKLPTLLKEVCQELSLSKTVKVSLLPFSDDDYHLSQKLVKQLTAFEVELINPNVHELKNCISNLDFMIAAPLHASIFSFSIGVPSVGINYDSKVHRLYKSFNCSRYCLSPQEITVSRLLETIELVIRNKSNLRLYLSHMSKCSKSKFEKRALNILNAPV